MAPASSRPGSVAPIKIAHVIARLNIGGSTVHVIDLAADLPRDRFTQLVVAGTENPHEGSMREYALRRGITPIGLPEMVAHPSLRRRDARALVRLVRLLAAERPEIVHTHTAKAGFLGRVAARLARVPAVVHTYHGHTFHGYYPSGMAAALRAMERALGRVTDRVIAISERIRTDLLTYRIVPAAKITVIPYGFRLDALLTAPRRSGAFRQELGLPAEAALVGIVGRIVPIKNHRLFLDAVARLAAADPRVRFAIVGDGVLRGEMEGHARRLGLDGRVVFTGWRADLAGIYADLDVLVIASDNEGTPVAAIEGMAAGCAVVATAVGGVPDLIQDGETGYLVPPGDAAALADAVGRALGDRHRARSVGRAARSAVAAHYRSETLVDRMAAFYASVVSETQPARRAHPAPDVVEARGG